MNIIEKLGITLGPWRWVSCLGKVIRIYSDTTTGAAEIGRGKLKLQDAKLMDAAPEMLEALIAETYDNDALLMIRGGDKNTMKMVRAIEKATGKTWDEIRELMEELNNG